MGGNLTIAEILIGLNNQRSQSDIGVIAQRSEKQSSLALALTSSDSSEQMGDPVSRNPQNEYYLYEISD